MNTTKNFLLLFVLSLSFSCSNKSSAEKEGNLKGTPEISNDADIKYINRMREDIAEGENTPNDLEPLRRHSAPDIVLIPDGMKPIVGQDSALNLMKQMWEIFDVKTEYHSDEIKIVGDIAIERGWVKEAMKNKKTGQVIHNTGNYLWISQRDKAGIWKQTRVIWNKRPD